MFYGIVWLLVLIYLWFSLIHSVLCYYSWFRLYVTHTCSSQSLVRYCYRVQFVFFVYSTNVLFCPLHIKGIVGLPRRIYASYLDLNWLSLVSSINIESVVYLVLLECIPVYIISLLLFRFDTTTVLLTSIFYSYCVQLVCCVVLILVVMYIL